MTQRLVTDQLIEKARRATGLERFDSDSYREGLDVFVDDVNVNSWPDVAIERSADAVVKSLGDRLKVNAYLNSRPELLKRPIERPVFVLGLPRTGTTLLNNLLAADPGRRSPLSWEIDEPVPPPKTAALYNDPRALAQIEAHRKAVAAYPQAFKYYRGSPIYPNECMFITMHDFKALIWDARGKLPGYRDWLFQADATSTYVFHKRFLQLLQADAPGQWNLKMPSHALFIPELLKVYPDARIVWTHRDPFTATGSFCSLMRMSYGSFGGNVDLAWISENYPWQAAQHGNRIMDARDAIGEDRIIDIHYADMVRDPIAAMRKLYKSLGDDFTPEAEAGIRGWLADNPQDKFGRHEYKLGEFGLTKESVAPLFERYLARYEVEREG